MPSSTRRGIVAVIAVGILAAEAGAQIMRRPEVRATRNRGGLSIGLVQGFGVVDGTTGSAWDFGSGIEYAARFERPLQSQALAMGVQASFARLPLAFSSSTFNGDARADITQLLAVLRYGGGYTFHSVYELTAGVIGFSEFHSSDSPERKLSSRTDYDAKVALGYGFGFGLSPSASIEIVQEAGIIIHQREGLAASQSNYPRIYVTRLGGKVTF